MRKSEMPYLPPELKQHITDVINSQFDFTQSDIIRLTAVRITELVKKQYGYFHYDTYNEHTMEYPDSYHIRVFFKALGYKEGENVRLVKTPWFEEAIPFNEAAKVGTNKVIKDHSTIGVVVTTDGSIVDIAKFRIHSQDQHGNQRVCHHVGKKTQAGIGQDMVHAAFGPLQLF